MSKKSWLKEFYPIHAEDSSLKTNLMRVQHSLRKWRGLRKEELKRHGITVVDDRMLQTKRTGNFVLMVDDRSCALCDRHASFGLFGGGCESCPLTRVRSGHRCDRGRLSEDQAPWHAWTYDQNPEPMIAALEKAEAALLREQARRKK